MKRLFFFLLLGLLFSMAPCAAQHDTIRLLAIGNSFSCNAVEQNLHEIAAADGVEMIIGNLYIGGCSIDSHVRNIRNDSPAYSYRKIGLDGVKVTTPKYRLSDAIKDERWDYVTVQQVSGQSGILSSYGNLPTLVAWVRQNAPQAQILFHQTWAYAKTAKHPDFKRYDCDQVKMTSSIQYATTMAAQQVGIQTIIPCLRAIAMLRDYVPEKKITGDGYHLGTQLSQFVASLTWYATISGKSVFGNSYRPKYVTQEEMKLAQAIADFAVFGDTRTLNSLSPLHYDEPPASATDPTMEVEDSK